MNDLSRAYAEVQIIDASTVVMIIDRERHPHFQDNEGFQLNLKSLMFAYPRATSAHVRWTDTHIFITVRGQLNAVVFQA